MITAKKESAPASCNLAETQYKKLLQKYTTLFSKIKAPFCSVTSALGFFLMLGSMGGMELGTMPEERGVIWIALGLLLLWFGAKGSGAL